VCRWTGYDWEDGCNSLDYHLYPGLLEVLGRSAGVSGECSGQLGSNMVHNHSTSSSRRRSGLWQGTVVLNSREFTGHFLAMYTPPFHGPDSQKSLRIFPWIWNSLPDYLNDSELSIDIFKRYLKTYFSLAVNYSTQCITDTVTVRCINRRVRLLSRFYTLNRITRKGVEWMYKVKFLGGLAFRTRKSSLFTLSNWYKSKSLIIFQC